MNRLDRLGYIIVLCDNLDRMRTFYHELLAFPVEIESDTGITFRAGSVFLGLRQRTRGYDGHRLPHDAPGVQLAFLVSPTEVDDYHRHLLAKGVEILDPPKDQVWGHRTVYFADPEGNLLEIYADLVSNPLTN